MSDTATPTEPTTDAPDAGTEAPEAPAQETDWKSEARKWEDRSKANHTALDELTGKYQSVTAERDSLSQERDALAQKVAEFEAKEQRATLAAEISEATGVAAAALRGDTREELEAHAAQLKSLLPTTAPAIPGAAQKPSSSAPVDPVREFTRNLFAREAQ